MTSAPPLPARPASYEVRVDPPQPLQPLKHLIAPSSNVVLQVREAKLFSNHPSFGGIRLFVKCEMGGNSESTEIVLSKSLNPKWTHQFEVPVLQGVNSKLELKLYEEFTPYESVLLGKVDIYTSQLPYYLGSAKTFPLDPVTRPASVPEFSIARFLLVLQSSLIIEFTDLSVLQQLQLSNQGSNALETGNSPSISSPPPPLPPRRSSVTLTSQTVEIASNSGSETDTKAYPMAESGIQKPLPPLPRGSPVSEVQMVETYESGTALLISANNTPHPVKPTQSWLGKISDYFSSGSSLVSDVWYHRMLNSEKNGFAKLESLYYAHETRGHTEMLRSNSQNLSSFVFLYVPGLYSGRSVGNGGKSAEGKLTKHQERVREMKALGLDARLIVVPNDGTVHYNAAIITKTIQDVVAETNKYIVLIGYSKGGVDAAAALSLNPGLIPWIRVFITLFSPLFGSHIASDIEDSMLRPVVFLAIKNLLEADTAAVRDLSFKRRGPFIAEHPFDERVPCLSLASAITTVAKTSPFLAPYKYILSKYNKENDGLVACQDAIYPGASIIIIPAMDHVGPRPEYKIYRNHVSFILATIQTALDATQEKWDALCHSLQQPPDTPSEKYSIPTKDPINEASPQSEPYPCVEDDFYRPTENVALEANLIDFGTENLSNSSTTQLGGPIDLELPPNDGI